MRIFGYEPEEAIGKPILLIVPPERQDEERNILARLSRLIGLPDFLDQLRAAGDALSVHELIAEREQELQ